MGPRLKLKDQPNMGPRLEYQPPLKLKSQATGAATAAAEPAATAPLPPLRRQAQLPTKCHMSSQNHWQ